VPNGTGKVGVGSAASPASKLQVTGVILRSVMQPNALSSMLMLPVLEPKRMEREEKGYESSEPLGQHQPIQ